MKKAQIAVVGCGNISGIYLKNLTENFDILNVRGVCDLIPERSQNAQDKFGAPIIYPSTKEVFADPEVDIVLNLTTPDVHADINLGALRAGKHAYGEKPLAVTREDGLKTRDLARAKGLRAGGAPDTFLGGGIQTCRKLIDEGAIGDIVGASAFFTCPGHERWHPDPAFYYKQGAGPVFDMGPYYITALIALLGPVESVAGAARITRKQRTITAKERYGEIIDVEVPTHVSGVMNFKSGAIGAITTSFDVWGAKLPYIEVYGTLGTLEVPDPNNFGGPVSLKTGEGAWEDIPLTHGYDFNARGLGLADMAWAIAENRPHRASVDLTFHALDVMCAFYDSSRENIIYRLGSTCQRPEPMAREIKF